MLPRVRGPVRETALPLLLCGLLALSGCTLFGGAGTPSPIATPTGTPTATPTPTFGPAVYDGLDGTRSVDRLREAGSWRATIETQYESNRSNPRLEDYPIALELRANTTTDRRLAFERRADGRTETTFVDETGGYERNEDPDGDVRYDWASRPGETFLVSDLSERALAGLSLRLVNDPGELPLEKVGYERLGGEPVAVYEANASETNYDLGRSTLVPNEARLVRYEQLLFVARDGRLVARTVSVEWVQPERSERLTYERRFRLQQTGNVTVEQPDWVDEARQTEDESAEEE